MNFTDSKTSYEFESDNLGNNCVLITTIITTKLYSVINFFHTVPSLIFVLKLNKTAYMKFRLLKLAQNYILLQMAFCCHHLAPALLSEIHTTFCFMALTQKYSLITYDLCCDNDEVEKVSQGPRTSSLV